MKKRRGFSSHEQPAENVLETIWFHMKISGSRPILLNGFSATHEGILPEMIWNMMNFITREKTA